MVGILILIGRYTSQLHARALYPIDGEKSKKQWPKPKSKRKTQTVRRSRSIQAAFRNIHLNQYIMSSGRDVETGEQTPLLGRRTNNELKEMEAESIKEKAVTGIAGCGFITSLLSILFESEPTAIISAILGLILSPYAVRPQ